MFLVENICSKTKTIAIPVNISPPGRTNHLFMLAVQETVRLVTKVNVLMKTFDTLLNSTKTANLTGFWAST